ncbi:acyltransferase [Echinicola soli]|uniref:Acyltransferase n=1 Tax=Echinicola soli TaxID=2591634 RepID=A0A514CEY4_9BACT|nr:acyltransferase [Echinicola soli]QDH78383.1 acyltransferase [Echinicola soli]
MINKIRPYSIDGNVSRFEKLDALRGCFAILVVFYHFTYDIFDPENYLSNFIFSQSYIFVDFFFVLSGFVICHRYSDKLNDTKSFATFMKKRFIRLYPLLVYSVLMYSILKLYGLINQHGFSDPNYSWGTWGMEILEALTLMNSNPIFGSSLGMNPVTWTISAEMICYFLFGVVLVIGKNRFNYLFLFVHIFCFGFLFLDGSYSVSGNFGFVRGILNFSIGVMVYSLFLIKALNTSILQGIYILFLVILLFVFDNVPDIYKLILPYIFGFGVYIFANDSQGVNFLKNNFFKFLGERSYSIYLNHYLILWVVYFLEFRILNFPYNVVTTVICLCISLFATLIYSDFTYKYIEIISKNRLSKWKSIPRLVNSKYDRR